MRMKYAVLLFTVVAPLHSCSSSQPSLKDALIGKWQQTEGKHEILEFFKDGILTTYYEEGGARRQELVGTYSVVDTDQVKIQLGKSEPYLSEVRVSGDELSQWLPPNDEALKFRRVK